MCKRTILAAQYNLDFLSVALYDARCHELAARSELFEPALFDQTPKPSGKKPSSKLEKLTGAGGVLTSRCGGSQ